MLLKPNWGWQQLFCCHTVVTRRHACNKYIIKRLCSKCDKVTMWQQKNNLQRRGFLLAFRNTIRVSADAIRMWTDSLIVSSNAIRIFTLISMTDLRRLLSWGFCIEAVMDSPILRLRVVVNLRDFLPRRASLEGNREAFLYDGDLPKGPAESSKSHEGYRALRVCWDSR